MGRVTSSSVPASLEETNASIVDGASDLALHLGWYLTPSPVEALEFNTSPIFVSLLCDLKNHAIVGSALPVRRFLIINLIEQGYLLVIGYQIIF
jgi:hypothetical protein